MTSLEDVLPAEVLDTARKTVALQEGLMSITEESIPEVVAFVGTLPFIKSFEGVRTLTNNLLLSVQYRPFNLFVVAKLTKALFGLAASDNFLADLKTFLLDFPKKAPEERWRVALVLEAHYIDMFTEEELFDAMQRALARFPIIQNRPFWNNNTRLHLYFFVEFAPIVEKKDPAMFVDFVERIKMHQERGELTANWKAYLQHFDEMKANDWELYRHLTRHGHPDGTLPAILKADDLDKLKEIAESSEFNPNMRIDASLFESAQFLLRMPTLAQFCALNASIKCFRFLVERGANLREIDRMKRTILHFAIAGGHSEIIDAAMEVSGDFVVATRVSAEFHRFDLFRSFLATKRCDLKANDIENGSIFHGIAAANHVRMILFCIEEGCDINLKDADGVCHDFIGLLLTVESIIVRWNLCLC